MPRNRAIEFVRKHIAGKGTTAHNGRGAYEMETSRSDADVWASLYRFLDKHRDKIDNVHIHVGGAYEITFKPEYGAPAMDGSNTTYYYTLYLSQADWRAEYNNGNVTEIAIGM